MSIVRQAVYDYKTTNKSFVEMSKFLRMSGVTNHSFMLLLYDESLIGVNPRDPFLTDEVREKIINEIRDNPWYFFREVVAIPGEKELFVHKQFKLNIGNLAFLWALCNSNIKNIYYLGASGISNKTTTMIVYLLYKLVVCHVKAQQEDDICTRIKNIQKLIPNYINKDKLYNLALNPTETIFWYDDAEYLQEKDFENIGEQYKCGRVIITSAVGKNCPYVLESIRKDKGTEFDIHGFDVIPSVLSTIDTLILRFNADNLGYNSEELKARVNDDMIAWRREFMLIR